MKPSSVRRATPLPQKPNKLFRNGCCESAALEVTLSVSHVDCCTRLLTVGGARRQTVRSTGYKEANDAASRREDPTFADCPHRSVCVTSICRSRWRLLVVWADVHLLGSLFLLTTRRATQGLNKITSRQLIHVCVAINSLHATWTGKNKHSCCCLFLNMMSQH